MITIESIRVRNFRSIREATFKPLEEGITGIFGANGAGKTTFLSATMWALFGVRPPEGSVASLRREGSDPAKDECSVSVLFKHMQQQVEVIRELKGKSNAGVVTIYVDGIKQTVASVTAADTWVLNRLGVDATGFENAFVIKQKELDKLITARQAERKQIIERLAGIETINVALKAAREAENGSRKVLANFPGSEQAVLEAETQVNLLTDKLEELSVDRDGLQAQQQRLIARGREIQTVLDSLTGSEIELNRGTAQLAAFQNELTSLRERRSSLAYLAELQDEAVSVESLREQHHQLTASLNELTRQANVLDVERQTLATSKGKNEQRSIELRNLLAQLPMVEESAETLGVRREMAEREVNSQRNAVAVAQSHIGSLRKSIEVIGHSDQCPTCHTVLDDTHALAAQFEADIVQYEADITAAQHSIKTNVELTQELAQILRELEAEQRARQELAQLEGELGGWAEREASVAAELTRARGEVDELAKQREKVTELGLRARNLTDDRAALVKVEQRLAEIDRESAALEQLVQQHRQVLQKANAQKLRGELTNVQQRIDANAPAIERATGDRSQIETRLAVAKNNYVTASDQWRRRLEMVKRQEERAIVTAKLDKFRADTISSLAPELSEHASSLISEITNGEFTEVQVDDEFNIAVVTAAGQQRPVGWLSGGELSAVALSLRIAIGSLITGGNPTLLWADEIMTAQDADRRGAMLSLIRSLPIDQIVLVNHTSDAADIVDKTITLKIDRKNGSYIADAE